MNVQSKIQQSSWLDGFILTIGLIVSLFIFVNTISEFFNNSSRIPDEFILALLYPTTITILGQALLSVTNRYINDGADPIAGALTVLFVGLGAAVHVIIEVEVVTQIGALVALWVFAAYEVSVQNRMKVIRYIAQILLFSLTFSFYTALILQGLDWISDPLFTILTTSGIVIWTYFTIVLFVGLNEFDTGVFSTLKIITVGVITPNVIFLSGSIAYYALG